MIIPGMLLLFRRVLGHDSKSTNSSVSWLNTLVQKQFFMKYLAVGMLLIFSMACGQKQQQKNISFIEPQKEEQEIIPNKNIIDPPMEVDSSVHHRAYKRLVSQIKYEKSQLLKGLNNGNVSMDSVGQYFTNIMRDSIFHYWYGTTWEFNGHTDIPREGEVACGYFISTPLKHIGVNVNRYKLAQQAATPIIKSIAAGNDIYRTTDFQALNDYLDQKNKDGIYVIGLSFHVGFILRENGENFMVHSDYYEPISVCKKSFNTCEALFSSDVYVVGDLSGNPVFLRKWLEGSRIGILSE